MCIYIYIHMYICTTKHEHIHIYIYIYMYTCYVQPNLSTICQIWFQLQRLQSAAYMNSTLGALTHSIASYVLVVYVYAKVWLSENQYVYLTYVAVSSHNFNPRNFTATVGFYNFNLWIFNLRVSNPNKLTVDISWHDVGFQCARVSAQQNTINFGNRP